MYALDRISSLPQNFCAKAGMSHKENFHCNISLLYIWTTCPLVCTDPITPNICMERENVHLSVSFLLFVITFSLLDRSGEGEPIFTGLKCKLGFKLQMSCSFLCEHLSVSALHSKLTLFHVFPKML